MPAVDIPVQARSESVVDAANTAAPFVHKFKTDRNAYVFDVNSGEIVRVDDVVWQIIEDSYSSKEDVISKYAPKYQPEEIARAYDEICTARESENLFLNRRPKITMPYGRSDFAKALNTDRQQLILNVTERCNFRCNYCAYTLPGTSWRSHGRQDMSWETARAAIDEFLAHCRFLKERPGPYSPPPVHAEEEFPPSISFYGGEPLLNFPVVKKCAEYILEKTKGQIVALGLTTNGYLLRGEAAKFLATHGFMVKVSFDGPADIHDRHRRTAEGGPTWATVLENIKTYIGDNPGCHPPSLAMTIPRNESLLEVQKYFAEAKWIPDNMMLMPSVESEPDEGYWDSINYPTVWPEGTTECYCEHAARLIKGEGLANSNREFLFQAYLFDKIIRDLHRRPTTKHCATHHQHLPEPYAPFTTCVAGCRRAFVDVDGHYYPCERVPTREEYRIGSVSTGIDEEKVCLLTKYFTECTFEQCKDCWCLYICRVACFAAVRQGTGFTKAAKTRECERARENTHGGLVRYCELLEQNPHALDHMGKDYERERNIEKLKEIAEMKAKVPSVG